jgi:uncharacterized membrane protein YqiK
VSATLNLTEILSALQDEITVGGAISAEHRSFYTTFRAQLDTYSGSFISLDIQGLLEDARNEASGDISDEEFEQFTKAVLSKISTKELLEIETKEQAEIRSAEQAAKDAEEAARKAEEEARAQIRKDEHNKALAEIEAAKIAAIEETVRIKAETAAQIQETKEAAERATAEAAARASEESAQKQAEAELEEAKRQAEIERLKLQNLTTQEPEPDAEPLSEIDESSKKIVPDIPPDNGEATLTTPVEEDSNNVSRLLIVTGLIVAIGLAVGLAVAFLL